MVSLDLSVAVVLGVDVGKEEVGDALHRALELLDLVRVRVIELAVRVRVMSIVLRLAVSLSLSLSA